MCINPHQTGFISKGSDHLQLIKFWPSCDPGKGVCGGGKFLASPYYSQRGVCVFLSAFFHCTVFYYWCVVLLLDCASVFLVFIGLFYFLFVLLFLFLYFYFSFLLFFLSHVFIEFVCILCCYVYAVIWNELPEINSMMMMINCTRNVPL